MYVLNIGNTDSEERTMTPQPGRPAIGPQITLRATQDHLERLTALATTNGTTRADEIRTAITNHLGPNVDPNTVATRAADIQANAWNWWPRSNHPSDLPEWGDQIAHAIWQANTIMKAHSDDWNPDLTPVWETIAIAELDPEDIHGEGPDWGDVLWQFARLVNHYSEDLGEHVLAQVDCVFWVLRVETGAGPFSAMRPATYTWSVAPGGQYMRNSIRASIDIDGRDAWSTAGRLVIKDLHTHTWAGSKEWEVNAPLVEQATGVLNRHAAAPEEAITMMVGRWEKERWEEAERRVGGMGHRPLDSDQGLEEWCAKNGHPTEHLGKWGDAARAARKSARDLYRAAVQADLDRLAAEEQEAYRQAQEARRVAEEAERKAHSRRRPFTPRRRGAATPEVENTPAPTEEPLADWERELLEGN